MADNTFPRTAVELLGAEVRNNSLRSRPCRGVYGVEGVVPVKLNEEVNLNVALVPDEEREKAISGGKVVLVDGMTLNVPPETASNERYCTVVPLIQCRTRVTEDSL